jgi:hypothetical protein
VAPQQRREGGQPRGGQQKDRQYSRRLKKTGRGALRARLPGSHSYQPVVLAEFVVAVVIVATGPIAKGGSPEAQAKGSPSPYSVNTLKQLVAIGGVYFVLAILASSRRAGRYAAWFGGLVLVVLGLAELASGELSAVFGIFGPASTAAPGAAITPAQQSAADAAAAAAASGGFAPVPDATGIFPAINPSTTQSGNLPGVTQGPPPGVAAGGSNVTQTTITPPVGGSGVITT